MYLVLIMKRLFTLALLSCSAAAGTAQAASFNNGPLISLYLPSGFPSEKVQVRYFMSGPFGGSGGFVESQPDRQSIDFVAAVDGRPAVYVKGFAFLPGCEIATFEFAVTGTAMWRQLECKPLKMITLRGHIPPDALAKANAPEVDVSYEADWARRFFGIADGFIPSVSLSRIALTEGGDFSVEVPDFQSQENLQPAGYTFILREAKTSNILGFLVAENASHVFHSVTVNKTYPALIQFSAVPPNPQK